MRQPSKDTIDYYILPNKIFCSLYGIWPSGEKPSTIRTVFSVLHMVLSIIIVCCIYVPEIIMLLSNRDDLSILAGAGSIVLTISQFLFKTLYLLVKRESACRLLEELKSLWYSTDVPAERQSYKVFAYWARTSTISFFVSGISTTFIFMLTATLDSIKQGYNDNGTSNRHLPYDIWYAMAYLKSPEFEIIYAGQVMASFTCCFAVCGIDGMFLTTILHLSGQFRLITTWLTNIGIEMNCTPIDLHKRPVKIVAGLLKCVRHHQRLIKMVKDVNILLTPIVFIHLLTSGIQICLTVYVLVTSDVADNMFKLISYLGTMMLQIVMYCWPGEILIQESQEVAYAAYLNVPWYQLPLCYRRYLLFMIMKSQKSCCINALTFESLSSRTLSTVFNAASSYFALLRNMQGKTA